LGERAMRNAQDALSARLRLALRSRPGGIEISFVNAGDRSAT
jgi:hypothetical protein